MNRDQREREVEARIKAAFNPRPAADLEAGVAARIVRPPGARPAPRRRWRVPILAAAAAALFVAGIVLAWALAGHLTAPPAKTNLAVSRPSLPTVRGGRGGLSLNRTKLKGTGVSSLAQAKALANASIKLPSEAVSGAPAKIVVWLPGQPAAPVTARLASRERSRIAIAVAYRSGAVLTAKPIAAPAAATQLSLWRALASQPASETGSSYLDGREHVGALVTLGGRTTWVVRSGVAHVVGHPSDRISVASTVSWIEDGVSYQLAQPGVPIGKLERIAASVP